MTKRNKRIFAWTSVNILIMMAVSIFGFSVTVIAGGGAAGGGSTTGDTASDGDCLNTLKTKWPGVWNAWDVCGAAWQLYPSDGGWGANNSGWPNWPEYGSSTETKNDILQAATACGSIDADFYFLSLRKARYNSVTDSIEYSNIYKYEKQVKDLSPINVGGSGGIYYAAGGGAGALPFDGVYDSFNQAKAYANSYVAAHPEDKDKFQSLLGANWPDVSWFCYSPEWGTPPPPSTSTAGFTSQSIVELSGDVTRGISSVTSDDGQKKTIYYSIDGDSTTVTFRHKLAYDHGTITMATGGQLVSTQGTDGSDDAADKKLSGVSTEWSVGTAYTDPASGTSTLTQSPTTDLAFKEVSSQSVTIGGLTPGSRSPEKCSKISYNHKKFL